MKLILIIGVFQAFFIALLIFFKREKSISDKILSAVFLLMGMTIFFSFLEIYNREKGYPYPFLINLSTPGILLQGPLLWFYVTSLTDQKFRLKPKYLVHLIPFSAILLLLIVKYFNLSAQQRIYMDSTMAFRHDIAYPIVVAAIFTVTQGYLIWGLIKIKRYNKNLRTYFSHIENIDLNWLRFLLFGAMISYATISFTYIFDLIFSLLPYATMQVFGFSIGALLILVLGFYGHRQGNVFVSVPIKLDLDRASATVSANSPLKKEEEIFIQKLLNFMKDKKPYLNTETNLAALSSVLEVSPDYLSNILNGNLNMNFFDFINHYRIEEFKNRLKDPQNHKLTLLSIAYDCGFNSKATFNRVFKKATGSTPSEYFRTTSENGIKRS